MALLEMIPGLKRVANTKGGEWAGSCVFCGGKDRFRIWPEQGSTGRYWCRSCGKSGDAITLLKERDGLSFGEACKRLGLKPSLLSKPGSGLPTNKPSTIWQPREPKTPGITWQEKACAFVKKSKPALMRASGVEGRAFLADRGLKPETIKSVGLGWNPQETYQSRQSWGLEPELNEKGKLKRIWLPVGLVIPSFDQGRVIRLKIRRANPGDVDRYIFVAGSSSVPMTWGLNKGIIVIVESELDGLLLHQEVGDLAGVVALGSAQARPDQVTHEALERVGLILNCLDSDSAGAKEAWSWWKRTYKIFIRWPVPFGKDPGEAFQKGLDLRAWVIAGLPESFFKREHRGEGLVPRLPGEIQYRPIPEAWAGLDQGTIERLCIITVDGGMTDTEAEARVLL